MICDTIRSRMIDLKKKSKLIKSNLMHIILNYTLLIIYNKDTVK